MRRRSKSLPVLAAALLGLAAATSPSSFAADDQPDTTPPVVQLDQWAHFTRGTTVDVARLDGGIYFSGTPRLAWQVADPSGICAQELAWQGYSEHWGEPDDVLGDAQHVALDPAARHFLTNESTNTFDEQRIPSRWVLRATDCAGNTGTSAVARVRFGALDDRSGAISYRGDWARVADSGTSGILDTLHRTGTRGARLVTRFAAHGPVALVVRKGPRNGRFQVWVDGVLVKSVASYRATARSGVVAWEGYFPEGTHRLRVVNLATRGHPRLEVDGLLLCQGPVTEPTSCGG